ncbi:DUF3624 domain-containing protein [Vibrio splendidus]|uniref:DUF3624 domain-containing protein n=1 Tax=Vibrio TaxID=662 RepID=UPI000C83B05C|nr:MULTISPECIES: DUF3624 domain-containing protein [Vibrio]MBO7912388.1 DUF3624 domain-containing protein [Vibrio sp. G41H]MCF7492048.1 DUF3624 domain-containing protein [Vibrio sp. G-C-1]PMO41453.1 hypothetical protein BCT10_19945 [Vibrio splendidus]PTP04275.1 DUF3624 domain-containing protein [Vibrio splendidus]PTP21204.1 DUF3624 domain-containing protein [Vibrio splendidus]
MTCIHCNKSEKIRNKLGRCQRCMNQLMVLSILSWGAWWVFFKEDPKTINAIALMMAAFAFSSLLSLHGIMKFVVLPLRNKKR